MVTDVPEVREDGLSDHRLWEFVKNPSEIKSGEHDEKWWLTRPFLVFHQGEAWHCATDGASAAAVRTWEPWRQTAPDYVSEVFAQWIRAQGEFTPFRVADLVDWLDWNDAKRIVMIGRNKIPVLRDRLILLLDFLPGDYAKGATVGDVLLVKQGDVLVARAKVDMTEKTKERYRPPAWKPGDKFRKPLRLGKTRGLS